ncbi:hypothetical protein [Methylobacterium iners]|uniref:Amino acid transporter n=1 Tax=Methylobacterium iners TaxID=418707 RepID=A0ABQ4RZM2_9HYPH|nr:hypothetical protein [Methylobacterium iners]GJD94965.1 hypothetical protein OCOJLMKI_2173 [Methylobacterium iners]
MTDEDGRHRRQVAINNERAKLLANALDRASTACLTVGVLGPTAASLYGVGTDLLGTNGILFGLGALLWLSVAASLHAMARKVLGRLR